MKNRTLNDELKSLIGNVKKSEVSKGTVGGFSIEIGMSSYIYYGNKENRDSDFNTLTKALK